MTAALVAMSVFAWQLQHDRGAEFRAMSDQQMMRCIRLPAERGLILDRNGIPLAVNVAEYAVAVVARMFEENDDDTRNRLAALLATSPDELAGLIEAGGEGESQVAVGRVAPDQARRIVDAPPPGVLVVPSGRRQYPYGAVLASVLGHVGVADADDMERWPHLVLGSRVGKAGLESSTTLCSAAATASSACMSIRPGIRWPPANAWTRYGATICACTSTSGSRTWPPTRSWRRCATSKGDLGAAVVMDARNGAVLALASVPGADNNVYGPPADLVALAAQSQTPGPSPLLNNATQTAVPPGSTFRSSSRRRIPSTRCCRRTR